MKNYKVYMRSKPGFYEQYSGSVSVFANSDEDAIEKAFTKLKTGSFPDRNKVMWKVERVERVFN